MYKIVSIQGVLGGTDTILGVDYRAKIKKKSLQTVVTDLQQVKMLTMFLF